MSRVARMKTRPWLPCRPHRHQLCAHFTICAKGLAAFEHRDRREKRPKAKRGRPSGRRMQCGRHCGAKLTASLMRTHFTACSKLAGMFRLLWTGEGGVRKLRVAAVGASDEMRLRLRRPVHWANMRAQFTMREAAGDLRPSRSPREERESAGRPLAPRRRPRTTNRSHPYPSDTPGN